MAIQQSFPHCLYNKLKQKNTIEMDKELFFEGHSLITVHNFDQDSPQSLLKCSNLVTTTAQENHAPMQEERFYQKEDIFSDNSIELSFEKSFMNEHAPVLQWEIHKYLEQVQIYLEKSSKPFSEIFPQGFSKTNQETSCQRLIKVFQEEKSQRFGDKLLVEVKDNDKLEELLDIVAKRCPLLMALQLIKISQQILEEYLKCVEDTVGLLDLYFLMNVAFQKSKKILNIKTLNLSSLASSDKEYRSFMLKYQKFIEIYCVTTILVLAQFFQNPYYQKQMLEPHKRALKQLQNGNEEIQMQEQVSLKPQKKRKSSKDTL